MTTGDLIDIWAERTEHRITKQSLKYVTQERNQLRGDLAQIAEDCTAWLHNECDETACEFIKAVRDYAHTKSQAPLMHTETPPHCPLTPDP
jgi:uncharacterized protein (DUF3084 family)